jgi:GLPGLI family protein
MKRITLIFGFALLHYGSLVIGQSIHGEIIYAQINHWPKIAAGLPYLTLEERDRINLTWSKKPEPPERMRLLFNDSVTYYTYSLEDKMEESTWSFKKEDYQIYRNYNQQSCFDRIGVLGKTYIVKDEIPKSKWKILGEIKEVSGYVCMKAETHDTIKGQKIIAWFTDKILIPSGPGEFGGLPGLILEIDINDKASTIIAESINLDVQPEIIPPKSKGKIIDYEKYRNLIGTYIKDCIERRRNPYWNLRY